MAAAASVGVAVRTLLSVLICVMVATLVYTIATDATSFLIEQLTRWMAALLIDFYINTAVVGAWVFYKESSWIMAAVWVVLFCTIGSIVACGYIIMQFFKLSPEESSKDPLYFVLVRHQKRDVMEHRRGPSVITARIIIAALGCLMLGTLVYMLIVDGSPFRAEIFTPWMVATLMDDYFFCVVLWVWVAYKESSWISAFLWMLLFVCFRSITTCAYIVWQLFYLSPEQPVSLVLFSSSPRHLQSSDSPLLVDANV